MSSLATALATLLADAPVTAYVLRSDGDGFVLVSANRHALARTPALAAFVGRGMSQLYASQPELMEQARRAVTEGRSVVSEHVVRRHDRLDVRQAVRLVFTPVDAEHLVVFSHDIDAPDLATEALRESEARHRSLVTTLPDGVILRDGAGRIVTCNEAAARILGHRSESDLIGRIESIPDGVRVETEAGAPLDGADLPSLRAIRTGLPQPAQRFVLRDADGASRWIRIAAHPVRGPEGAILGAVAIYADETQRVSTERAATESATRLSLALEGARMGVWDWEPGIDRGSWSEVLRSMFRLETVGNGIEGFLGRVHPDDRAGLRELAARTLMRSSGDGFEHECRLVGDDGVTRWVQLRGRIVRSPTLRVVGTMMDVTEHRASEEARQRSEQLAGIERLAGATAHELNNLLAAMSGSLELLDSSVVGESRDDLAILREGVGRASDLSAQLLAVARRAPLALVSVDLAALVRENEQALVRVAGPGVELVLGCSDGCWARVDAAQLAPVLASLVARSRDVLNGSGRITVRTRREDRLGRGATSGVVLFEIEDDGPALDARARAHLFDPRPGSASGLDLVRSQATIRQHGGEVEVESGPGRGCRVRVVLPASAPPVVTSPVVTQTARPGGTLLLVDDDELVLITTKRLLEGLGYRVLAASSAAAAIGHAVDRDTKLDALVCDVTMPDLTGPELAAQLRDLIPGLRVLFVSGYSDVTFDGHDPRTRFLPKPYSRVQLAEGVAKLLTAD